jgi:hypothetical protein
MQTTIIVPVSIVASAWKIYIIIVQENVGQNELLSTVQQVVLEIHSLEK